jgi:hypothetical protein
VSMSARAISKVRPSEHLDCAGRAKGETWDQAPDVVQLEARRTKAIRRDPRRLIEAVYSAGSLMLAPADVPARLVAVILAGLGFLVIEEIQEDGSAQTLPPVEQRRDAIARPWRVSKPPFGGEIGIPDAVSASAANIVDFDRHAAIRD